MLEMREILVIVPAYNEAANVAAVIKEVREALPHADVLVINDGSADDTGAVARRASAYVVDLPYNLGIGGAVQTGYLHAWDNGYNVAIQVDGDGQHDPREILRLLSPLQAKQADLVIGSRFVADYGYRAPFARRLGIAILARVISLVMGQRVTDTTSGFRAVNRKGIRLFAHQYPHDYPEPESLVLASRVGLRIQEVGVHMNPRQAGRSSITFLRAGYYIVKVLLAILIGLLRQVPQIEEEPDV